MAQVRLAGIGKTYPDGTSAVKGLDLDIADGEFLVLVGPSGCGKTTALRMVAGLEEITAGTLTIGERVVNRTPARDRDVAMVFQSYALYPHLSVRDNIGFGLQLRKLPKSEIKTRVEAAAATLGLTEHLDRRPRNLSGGQRQRVAMGRAIVRQPQAFLMDEPLSNLDAKLRVQMRAEISRIQRDLGVTTIYVTHDQVEAMTLGDRVAVMKKGVLQQVAPPQELYLRPANIFVAGFIGSPAMNLLQGRLVAEGGALRLELGGQTLAVPAALAAERPRLREYAGRDIAVGIRPEDMEDAALGGGDDGAVLASTTDLVEALGSELLVHFRLAAPPVVTEDTRELARDAGADDLDTAAPDSDVIAKFSPRSTTAPGSPVRVRVDTERLYFFDPVTGEAIWGEPAPAPQAKEGTHA
ncbi:sn-glycerol-3-phosphate ABC transporter ATP-binding protein UgpC [Streptomonospora sp. S1-112]|uniref:Sn-glycerol-3-phosphate ABC transporter ATP-binding protein UgpC n=1 Tax=Streptomonospora mangrovi TaxID=2883123 RepID=A0A9X3NQH2_9ACTN|nr:sn-glycerol-3-phosphate ABC transporter ATP-binding protein UgpC [Streptomonospora mangrovi]MDA0568027.1 sn-glycerol-3-phosphate ABC transporter ATP-binding protein UgpC [Streptomonospora mangrovi]